MQQQSSEFDAGHIPHKRHIYPAVADHDHQPPQLAAFPQLYSPSCKLLSTHFASEPPSAGIELVHQYNTEVAAVGTSYMQLQAPHVAYLPELPVQVIQLSPAFSSHPIKIENMSDCGMAPQVGIADESAAHYMQSFQELLLTHDQQAVLAGNLFHGDKLLPVLQSSKKQYMLLPPLQPIDRVVQHPLTSIVTSSSEPALGMMYTNTPESTREIPYSSHLNYSKTMQPTNAGVSTSLFGSDASFNVQQQPLDILSVVSTRCISPLENASCGIISTAVGRTFPAAESQIPSGQVPTNGVANITDYRGFSAVGGSPIWGTVSGTDKMFSVPCNVDPGDVWEDERSPQHLHIAETMPEKTVGVMSCLDGKNTASITPTRVPAGYHQLLKGGRRAAAQPALCRSTSMVAGCPRMLHSTRTLDASGARDHAKMKEAMHSKAAANRRRRIQERLRVLRALVPGGAKIGTHLASMLELAAKYVCFLQAQHTSLLNEIDIDNLQSSQAISTTCAEASASSLMCSIGHEASNISDCPIDILSHINPRAKWRNSTFSQAPPSDNVPPDRSISQTSVVHVLADQRYSPQQAFTECVRNATRFSSCMQDPSSIMLPQHVHDQAHHSAPAVGYCALSENTRSGQAAIEDNLLPVNANTTSHTSIGMLNGRLQNPSARPFMEYNVESNPLLSLKGNHQQGRTQLPRVLLTPTGDAFNHGPLPVRGTMHAPGSGVGNFDLLLRSYSNKVLFHHLLLSAQVQEQLCRTGSCLVTLEQANRLNFNPARPSNWQSTAAGAPQVPPSRLLDPFVHQD